MPMRTSSTRRCSTNSAPARRTTWSQALAGRAAAAATAAEGAGRNSPVGRRALDRRARARRARNIRCSARGTPLPRLEPADFAASGRGHREPVERADESRLAAYQPRSSETRFAAHPPASMADVARGYGELFVASSRALAQPERLDLGRGFGRARPACPTMTTRNCDRSCTASMPRWRCGSSRPSWDYLYDSPINDEIVKRRAAINELLNERGSAQPRAHTLVEFSLPHEPRILVRGNPTRPGKHVPRQFLSVLGPAEPEAVWSPPRGWTWRGPSPRRDNPLTARVTRQSRLGSSFRRGPGAHAQQFRPARRSADASRIARFSGGALHGRGLVDQETASLDHALERLSAKQPRRADVSRSAIPRIDCCGK